MAQIPNNWGYGSALDQIKRQREYAKRLQDFEMNQGRVTNPGGFFAGGATGLDALAKALTGYMGGQQDRESDAALKQAETDRRELLRQAREELNTPGADELDIVKQSQTPVTKQVPKMITEPQAAADGKIDPEQAFDWLGAGGRMTPPPVAPLTNQPIGVPQEAPYSNDGRNNPTPIGVAPQPRTDASMMDTRQIPMPQQAPRRGSMPRSGYFVPGTETSPTMPVAPAPTVLPQATQVQQTVVTPPPGGTAFPEAVAQAPRQSVQTPFNDVPDDVATDARNAELGRQLSVLTKTRESKAIEKLYRAGREDLADRYAFPEPKDNKRYVVDKTLVDHNGNTVFRSPNTPDAMKEDDQAKLYLNINKESAPIRAEVAVLDASVKGAEDLMKLVGQYNAFGGVASSLYGAVAKAAGNDKANEIQTRMNLFVGQNLKAMMGGQLTDGEREFVQGIFSAFSAGKIPTQQALNDFIILAQRKKAERSSTLKQFDDMAEAYKPARMRGQPQTTEPGTINGRPAPGKWNPKV